jgi:hypothetical protein
MIYLFEHVTAVVGIREKKGLYNLAQVDSFLTKSSHVVFTTL